jgi:hypothetical protein
MYESAAAYEMAAAYEIAGLLRKLASIMSRVYPERKWIKEKRLQTWKR